MCDRPSLELFFWPTDFCDDSTRFSYFYYPSRAKTRLMLRAVGRSENLGGGTMCSNGFYADIWSQRQMQQYQLCLKSFYKILVVLKYHRRLWNTIFDTDIFRCINTHSKGVYLAFSATFMLLGMSVSKIFFHRP